MFNLRRNRIILHKKNGKTQIVSHIKGLTIKFKGENSTVEIWEPYCFKLRFFQNRSKIKIKGSNNHIEIRPTKHFIYSLQINNIKDNNRIFIGDNFYQTGALNVDFANLSGLKLEIGNDCMFGQDVQIMLGDHHTIYSTITGEQTNISQKGITIGNHVWAARNTKILKDVEIPDNTVIATGSIVTKSFNKTNTLIGGTPAKILKENINWDK